MSGVYDSQRQQAQMRGEICFQLDLPQRVWEWVLSLYHVVSRDGTQAVRLGGKHLYWLSHLPGLLFMTFITVEWLTSQSPCF